MRWLRQIDLRVLCICLLAAMIGNTLLLLVVGARPLSSWLNTTAMFIAAFYFGRWCTQKGIR